MAGFVDLHAHYLAGLDDGATEVAMSLQMVRAVAALGFSELYATPHQRSGMFLPDLPSIRSAHGDLSTAMATTMDDTSPPRLGLAAENFWDEVFLQRTRDRQIPSYDGGPAFLFEVHPQLMPTGLEATLFDLRVKGYLPVLAHPERYVAIQQQLDRASAIGRTAALLIDLGAIAGAHGKAQQRTVKQLLTSGLVHAAASDMHRPEDQRPIAEGMAWIRKQLGPSALEVLLSENPRRILAGDLPDPWQS
jgi:protein-tyrosine phosphatase